MRSSRIVPFSTASPTNTPGHTADSNSCFETRRPACAGQELQQRERLRRERHDLVAAIQVAADRIEPEFAEGQDAVRSHGSDAADLTESSPIDDPLAHDFARHALRITDQALTETHTCISYQFVSIGPGASPRRCGSRVRPTGGGRRGCAERRSRPHKHYDDSAPAPAPAPGAPLAPRLQNLGVHTFPVSTKVERAQLFMNQGLNLTYGFNHAEAGRAFAEAARLDPTLAMAYWGQALVLGPNINAPMAPEAEPKALELLQKAIALKAQGHAARARLHRCARRALHRQGRRSRCRRSRLCRRDA